MSGRHSAPQKRKKGKGGRIILSALCRLLGTIILIGVIVMLIPLTVPRLLGYEVYNVISGSMYPAIPQGSLVLVQPADPYGVEVGDVIAFSKEGNVITHRVTENHYYEEEFVTKGDANDSEDLTPIPYPYLIGVVTWHVPVMGELMGYATTGIGKIYLLCLLACGVMFNILAGRLRDY